MFKCLLLIVVLSASSASINVEAMPNPGSKNCRCRHLLNFRPLCASNGESYANNSDLECDKCNYNYDIVKVHDGYCDGYLEKFAELEKMQSSTTPKNCDCIYSNNYEPLCGSNGKSYLNNVELECDKKCINNYDIVKIHDGYCEEYL